MPFRHYCIAFLCVFATSFARKSQNEWGNNDWALSNTMSTENGDNGDTIDIDNNQGWSAENSRLADWSAGSGAKPQYDEWGSGNGYEDSEWSDEENDDDYGSGGAPVAPYRPTKPGAGPPDENQPDRSNSEGTDDLGYDDIPKNQDRDFEIKETEDDDEEPEATPAPETEIDHHRTSIIGTPGLLPGIIGGAVVGLLCAVLLVMFIVYRMRKKDEGSYALEEPKMTSPSRGYTRAPTKEYWA